MQYLIFNFLTTIVFIGVIFFTYGWNIYTYNDIKLLTVFSILQFIVMLVFGSVDNIIKTNNIILEDSCFNKWWCKLTFYINKMLEQIYELRFTFVVLFTIINLMILGIIIDYVYFF